MSPSRAAGGASALYGAGLIITSEARAASRSSAMVMLSQPPWDGVIGSEVGVVEHGFAALVEGSDPLDAVGMDRGAPVGVHHDGDRLLDGLPLSELDRALDRLDGCGGVAGDLLGDLVRSVHQSVGSVDLV